MSYLEDSIFTSLYYTKLKLRSLLSWKSRNLKIRLNVSLDITWLNYRWTVEDINGLVHPSWGLYNNPIKMQGPKNVYISSALVGIQVFTIDLLCRVFAIAAMYCWAFLFVSWNIFSATSLWCIVWRNHKVWHPMVLEHSNLFLLQRVYLLVCSFHSSWCKSTSTLTGFFHLLHLFYDLL